MPGIFMGAQSFRVENPPGIAAWASVAGKKERQGPLGRCFDKTGNDTLFGQKTWEQAEKTMQQTALNLLAEKLGKPVSRFPLIFSGDLLNQCIGSAFSVRNTGVPHLGLYGACSTMAEGLLTATMAVSGGFFPGAVAMTSSHFASSERQYRFPLGYGGQRAPSAQWTVTGSGAVYLSPERKAVNVTGATVGSVADLGVKDAANMGAAMAPAAFQTIKAHFEDFGTSPADYDRIVTGDLGFVGKELLLNLAQREGLSLGGKLEDCGCLIFDRETQDVHAGGSGCGCSAVVLCGHYLEQLKQKKLKRILFCGTGALLSPTSTQQGLPIPGVCHAVVIEGA